MNAIVLNRILIALVITMLAGVIAGFYFATTFLTATARQTDHIRTDSAMTQDNLVKLRQLQTTLESRKESVERAQALVGTIEDFNYQNRVVEDLTRYAALAGPDVKVTNFTFTDPTKKAAATPNKAAVNIPGVQVLDATATLNTPVRYTSFLRFLRAIEQNLTKMQVTGVNISPDKDDPSLINGPTINLQIYVRNK